MAGYILKAAKKSPWKSKNRDLWNPHPKQSKPNTVLNMQGIIYFSKLMADLFCNFTKKIWETFEGV